MQARSNDGSLYAILKKDGTLELKDGENSAILHTCRVDGSVMARVERIEFSSTAYHLQIIRKEGGNVIFDLMSKSLVFPSNDAKKEKMTERKSAIKKPIGQQTPENSLVDASQIFKNFSAALMKLTGAAPMVGVGRSKVKVSDWGTERFGTLMLQKYESECGRISQCNATILEQGKKPTQKLNALSRNVVEAARQWAFLERQSKSWNFMQSAVQTLTARVRLMCDRVKRLDQVLEILQKNREKFIVKTWKKQKNAILKKFKSDSDARLNAVIRNHNRRKHQMWQAHFEQELERYQNGGAPPQGFQYEVALLSNGRPTGKWVPCRIDFTHNMEQPVYDITVAGGRSARKIPQRWIRQGRRFKNNMREKMENNLATFKPKGAKNEDLEDFYKGISPDKDESKMTCPLQHELSESDKMDHSCDVCLRKYEVRFQFQHHCKHLGMVFFYYLEKTCLGL
mmetsp:Transcript_22329/g.33273  ORF Transcript_22329/g.33273 Transcript_22329/m.33273 type:complete len:454 (+) Transcript_22329:83-1444(+)